MAPHGPSTAPPFWTNPALRSRHLTRQKGPGHRMSLHWALARWGAGPLFSAAILVCSPLLLLPQTPQDSTPAPKRISRPRLATTLPFLGVSVVPRAQGLRGSGEGMDSDSQERTRTEYLVRARPAQVTLPRDGGVGISPRPPHSWASALPTIP